MSRSGSARPKVGKGSRIWEADNRPPAGEPWVWFTMKMMESPAFQALSLPARRALDRICIEHMAHAGRENGNLVVTSDDFRKAGISGKHLSGAKDELEALGFVQIKRGRGGNANYRHPNRYGLTWLPIDGGRPLNKWKLIMEEDVKRVKFELNRRSKMRAKKNPVPTGWPKAGPPVRPDGRRETKH